MIKRIPTVFLASLLPLITLLVYPFSWRVAAQETNPEGTVEVIVQTDGSPQALTGQVQNLGGNIEFIYENVPAMVVSLPAGQEK
jgi:hypothetical protein